MMNENPSEVKLKGYWLMEVDKVLSGKEAEFLPVITDVMRFSAVKCCICGKVVSSAARLRSHQREENNNCTVLKATIEWRDKLGSL